MMRGAAFSASMNGFTTRSTLGNSARAMPHGTPVMTASAKAMSTASSVA
jgi:hypothetical protein